MSAGTAGPQLGARAEPRPGVEARTDVVAGAALLALPSAELGLHLRAVADRNPALVVRERPGCRRCGRPDVSGPSGTAECGACTGHPAGAATRPDTEPPAVVDPRARLEHDLTALLPARLRSAALAVLDALDEHGLLPAGRPAGVPEPVRRRVVAALREVGPPGIAAATVEQSLLLQLDEAPLDAREDALARRVLGRHAAVLASGGPAAAAAVAGCTEEEMRALLGRLARLLRPHPFPDGGLARPTQPPDLLFEPDGDGVRAVLPERERWSVEVVRARPGSAGPDARERREARDVAARVNRRWSLLERLGAVVAAEHGTALRAGSTAFGPLTQATAAARLGVHESTVSRCVRHRTARLPDGRVVPLRRLFGTGHDARDAVARLCAQGRRPSDRRIADELGALGFRVARRTVAKYRAQLGLT